MAADYLVLDLEWNQPVDPAAPQLQNLKTTLNGEIIQIGAVTLNAKGKITGTYTWLVRPTFLRQMHYHVRSLTGLTMQKVKKGILFPEANRQLAALCSPDTLLLTWGPDDIHILRQNLLLHNLENWVGSGAICSGSTPSRWEPPGRHLCNLPWKPFTSRQTVLPTTPSTTPGLPP